jgi:membrane protein implicated in regulation of membrane protease activity
MRIVWIVLCVLFGVITLAAVLSFVGGGDMITDGIIILAFGGLATWTWQRFQRSRRKAAQNAHKGA